LDEVNNLKPCFLWILRFNLPTLLCFFKAVGFCNIVSDPHPADSPFLLSLVRQLAGEFSNQVQALEQPIWFVSIRLWQRPLTQRVNGKLALFAEQANSLYLEQAYRQRVIVFESAGDRILVRHLGLRRPSAFAGAGSDLKLLAQLTPGDLEDLPGCRLNVQKTQTGWQANMFPGDRCRFPYDGKVGEVVLGFELTENQFLTFDRGVDSETGRSLWGALMGPYRYQKMQDFSHELPL
jgi:hypothetical protein